MRMELLCAGIGGRGVLLASTILIETAIRAGYRAMASDEYGMSQRGGSVVSLVKIGDIESPLIGREGAGIMLAFEESEFYRNVASLKRGGMAIINSVKTSLIDSVASLLSERSVSVGFVDADGISRNAGMMQAANMALLGFFSHFAPDPFGYENLEQTIREKVPPKVVEKNIEVFRLGYDNARA